ncbi:helix-turn-helix transcriptional regulator [Exiguobacterium sp. s142]|uniref:helix-turn-helix domain-containing protein n=1 Tax=Exiguobacterium sp. s142 TaxID=2751222 RepID=UPI001BEB7C07
MEEKNLPYRQPIDYRQIAVLRILRNKTQREFADMMEITHTTLSALENGNKKLTPYYEDKVRNVLKRLAVSNADIVATRQLVSNKERRGYRV